MDQVFKHWISWFNVLQTQEVSISTQTSLWKPCLSCSILRHYGWLDVLVCMKADREMKLIWYFAHCFFFPVKNVDESLVDAIDLLLPWEWYLTVNLPSLTGPWGFSKLQWITDGHKYSSPLKKFLAQRVLNLCLLDNYTFIPKLY